jgi:hypothetical protein
VQHFRRVTTLLRPRPPAKRFSIKSTIKIKMQFRRGERVSEEPFLLFKLVFQFFVFVSVISNLSIHLERFKAFEAAETRRKIFCATLENFFLASSTLESRGRIILFYRGARECSNGRRIKDFRGGFLKKLSWGVALHRFKRSLGRSVIENVLKSCANELA